MRVSIVVRAQSRTAAQGGHAPMRRTVDAVLAQAFRSLEVIVVGDDRGAEVVAAIARGDPRVRHVRQEQNGAAAARRSGLRAARGELVGFLDDGDVLLPGGIARRVARLDASPRLGAVYGRHHQADDDGRVVDTVGRQPDGDLLLQLVRGFAPWTGSVLVRRALLDSIGDDESLAWYGDPGPWLRVALAGRDFGCVQEPLGVRGLRVEGWTTEDVASRERDVLELLAQTFRRWALPGDFVAQRDAIDAAWHFRFGCRHVACGARDAAARSFACAAAKHAAWACDPVPMLELLREEALSPHRRSDDPAAMVSQVLDLLPPALAASRAWRGRTVGGVHAVLALRAYAAGDRAAARARLVAALAADATLASAPDRFAALLVDHARLTLPDERSSYFFHDFLELLPPAARGLAPARRLALAELAVAETVRHCRLRGTTRPPSRAVAHAQASTLRPELLLQAPRRAATG